MCIFVLRPLDDACQSALSTYMARILSSGTWMMPVTVPSVLTWLGSCPQAPGWRLSKCPQYLHGYDLVLRPLDDACHSALSTYMARILSSGPWMMPVTVPSVFTWPGSCPQAPGWRLSQCPQYLHGQDLVLRPLDDACHSALSTYMARILSSGPGWCLSQCPQYLHGQDLVLRPLGDACHSALSTYMARILSSGPWMTPVTVPWDVFFTQPTKPNLLAVSWVYWNWKE